MIHIFNERGTGTFCGNIARPTDQVVDSLSLQKIDCSYCIGGAHFFLSRSAQSSSLFTALQAQTAIMPDNLLADLELFYVSFNESTIGHMRYMAVRREIASRKEDSNLDAITPKTNVLPSGRLHAKNEIAKQLDLAIEEFSKPNNTLDQQIGVVRLIEVRKMVMTMVDA